MSTSFEFEAELRNDVGKGASRRLRRVSNLVPAIIYGAGKEPTLISLAHNKVNQALSNEAFFSLIHQIKVAGKIEDVIIKAVQRSPHRPQVLHLDFLRVKSDEPITVRIPLHFIDEDQAPGVKQSGGIIARLLTEVEVKCLPKALPEFIAVDLSKTELDETIHMSDLKLPKGVSLTVEFTAGDEYDQAIAAIHLSKQEVEPEVTEEAAAEEETTAPPSEEGKGKD